MTGIQLIEQELLKLVPGIVADILNGLLPGTSNLQAGISTTQPVPLPSPFIGLLNPNLPKPAPVVPIRTVPSTWKTKPGVLSASGLGWSAYWAKVSATLPAASQDPWTVQLRTDAMDDAQNEYLGNPESGHNTAL